MKTAFEAALERHGRNLRKDCPIPLMTHEYARHWEQPDPIDWIFSDTEVLMPEADFKQILDYSFSCPTGVYEGKTYRKSSDGGKTWHLHWWSASDRPGYCADNVRLIVTL